MDEIERLELEIIDREACKRSYLPFVERMTPKFKHGWHINIMADLIEQIKHALKNPFDEELCRLFIVTMPPRHMKSQNMARCGPLWIIADEALRDIEVLIATYGADLSLEHGSWVKTAADKDQKFKEVFPDFELQKDSKSKDRLVTKEGGGLRFVGRGGGTTGRGAHLFVVDDPIKDEKEADSEQIMDDIWKWYWGVVETRLAPGGVVVVMHTRWRTNDLIGMLLAQDKELKTNEWKLINFPLIAKEDEYHPFYPEILVRKKGEVLHPERFNLKWAKRKELRMPSRQFLSLYQQDPVAEQGNFFKREHLSFYNPEDLPKDLYIFISTDFAVSEKSEADYTCFWPYGVCSRGHIWFLFDFFHEKVRPGTSVKALIDQVKRNKPINIQIEKGVIAKALGDQIEREMLEQNALCSTVSPTSDASKISKASSAQTMMEFGLIHLPNLTRVHLEVVPELMAFDKGEHDDYVDTIAMAARCVKEQLIPTPTGVLDGIDEAEFEDDEEDEDEPERKGIPSLLSGNW